MVIRRRGRILIIVLLIILIAAVVNHKNKSVNSEITNNNDSAEVTQDIKSGSYNKTITTADGLLRSYIVHIPTGHDPKKKYPLVLVFHGGFGWAENIETQSGMSQLADKNGFIAVYPNGIESNTNIRTWNAGDCCGYSSRKNIDDVSFVRQLVDSLEKTYSIDKTKLFATGMSNGGMLTSRLACEASDLFTAVAPVAGTLQISECNPVKKVPILIIHGTEDKNVPFAGGVGEGIATQFNTFVSVMDFLSDWAKRNNCTGNQIVESVPLQAKDSATVDKISYQGCETPTILYRVNGGGHAWPGSSPSGIPQESDTPTQSMSATKVIWDFFSTF